MASNWMFNNGLDDDSEVSNSSRMSRRKARRIRDTSNKSYGGYVYDYDDRKEAQEVLGDEYWEWNKWTYQHLMKYGMKYYLKK